MTRLRKRIRDVILDTLIAIVLVTAFAKYVTKTHDAIKVRNWTPSYKLEIQFWSSGC
jgi:hypothetical protein